MHECVVNNRWAAFSHDVGCYLIWSPWISGLNNLSMPMILFDIYYTISVLSWAHICMKCSLGISNFLEEISSLSHSVVFLYFFALIAEEGFLILFFGTLHSNGNTFPFLLCFSLLFFSQLFVRPPQTNILLFCISLPWGWSWSLSPVQCHEPPPIVHQALCLSDLSLKSISHFHCIVIRDLI